MPYSFPASTLDLELQPGKPPILRTAVTGDAQSWAAGHRDSLRAIIAEHGCVLRRRGMRYLIEVFGPDGLPFTTRFGNGDPIGEDVIRLLNDVYEAHTAREPWQAGDLLLVDNVRAAHSRYPFEGPREVLVTMADPVRLTDCSPTIELTRG